MNQELGLLTLTAASLAFFHTLMGPDHYVPFIVMAKAKKWSYFKTIVVTVLCGLGHILSSIVLGLVGVGLGVALERLEWIESARGNWAAWGLIAFGVTYMAYGFHRAAKNKPHTHPHVHADGTVHTHHHTHHQEHCHVHAQSREAKFNYVPWVLFVIFVLGPCEPLIPMLMYPAAKSSVAGMLWVGAVFGLVTIGTMLGVVILGVFGANAMPFKRVEKYSHALAGLTILLCGCAIQFLGL